MASKVNSEVSNPARRCLDAMIPYAGHGFGMFAEAFVLFSIGNVKAIFRHEHPACWEPVKKHECSPMLTHGLAFVEVGGVILGMIIIGSLAGRLGRRHGSILTALLMLLGVILLVCATGPSASSELTVFVIGLGIFGLGVGGEYPIASASAAERAEKVAAENRTSTNALLRSDVSSSDDDSDEATTLQPSPWTSHGWDG
eukprot:TRINITY_DN19367_c0_g1_i3.p1 TRINITY_DN19367_c0_g1~~TRINITY_DN19367_c0_g1_i3.p1  ORF type:complete len:199 (-),score=37.11 TRINITY_DN19367_c0_g1_i3:788-1384(-)